MATPRSGAPTAVPLHARCELTNYGRGEVLFVGQAAFSPGIWVGIALDAPLGKNDGSVQGKRYFETEKNYGVFVRSSQVRLLAPEDEEEEQAGEGSEYVGAIGEGSGEQVDLDDEGDILDEEEPVQDVRRAAPQAATSRPAAAAATTRPSSTRPLSTRPGLTASQRATPVQDGRLSSAALSSRSTSPVKRVGGAAAARPGTMRPPSAAASTVRPRVAPMSPQKPTHDARTGSSSSSSAAAARTSPFKTPARTPMTRTNTAPGTSARLAAATRTTGAAATSARASLAPSPAIGASARPARPASSMASARTPATARVGAATTTTAQARQAVASKQAPDSATARAGLRSVVKQRPSMMPPSTVPRTPASSAHSAARASESSTASSNARSPSARQGQAARAAQPHIRSPAASTSVRSPQSQSAVDDDEEDLLSLNAEEEGVATLEDSNDDPGPGSPSSPSMRKLQGGQIIDHMSLNRGPSMTSIARNNADVAAVQRELEEVRTRLRISEKKREEERDAVRAAEAMRNESEQILAIKPKLIAKQEELQNELKDLRKQEKEWETQRQESERQISELTDQVELLSLDKEFAEEKAEASAEELQAIKDRLEEVELDLEVQREELARYNEEPEEGGNQERSSVAFIQLEKQNDRLKDALVRLRDMTAETDAEQKQHIAELQKELRSLDEIQDAYEATSNRLQTTEALLEDLKIQLDDALGAEEMLEQLTERNMSLTEKVNDMQAVIEELEALKEVNDELEETHVETEKQLQEEVDLKDLQLREHRMRSETLEANLLDYESTFAQFRELVMNLQSENEALRNDEKTRDADMATNKADDQAVLNLNLKLQSSSLKSQAKTIELELGKLNAAQAMRQIEITSTYLPKRYFEQDKDSVESLLFFQRLAAKSEVIKTVVEGSHDIASSLVGVVDERLITICGMRHSLAHFIASARQISALVQLSTVPTFLKSGRMFKELTSIERRIDHYIDLLRREELKEEECGAEYRRFVKMLEDYEFALLDGASEAPDSDLAAKELGSAILFELDLDTITAALGFSKQAIASFSNDFDKQAAAMADTTTATADGSTAPSGGLEMRSTDVSLEQALFEPLQDIINHLRSAKVPARKLVRRLTTLYENNEAVTMNAIISLPGLGRVSSELVTFATKIAASFGTYVADVRSNKMPFDLAEVLAFVDSAAKDALTATATEGSDGKGAASWALATQETANLNKTVNELLNAATDQDNVIGVSGALPWSLRADEIRQEQSQNVEAQRVILKQTEDLRDLYKQIKARDEVLEENRIKIERLAKSLQRSRLDNETVGLLRDDLTDATKRVKAYEEGNSALQAELEQLQRQYEQLLSQKGSTAKAGDGSATDGDAAAEGTVKGAHGAAPGSGIVPTSSILPSSNYEVSYLVDQLEALQGALRHVRLENSLLKGRDLIAQVERLPVLASKRWTLAATAAEADQDKQMASADEGILQQQRGLPKSRKEGRGLGTRRPGQAVAEVRKQAESKSLVQEWMRLNSCPRVVKLPPMHEAKTAAVHSQDGNKVADGQKDAAQPRSKRRGWVPLAQLPHVQLQTQIQERARLRAKIEALAAESHNGSGHPLKDAPHSKRILFRADNRLPATALRT